MKIPAPHRHQGVAADLAQVSEAANGGLELARTFEYGRGPCTTSSSFGDAGYMGGCVPAKMEFLETDLARATS